MWGTQKARQLRPRCIGTMRYQTQSQSIGQSIYLHRYHTLIVYSYLGFIDVLAYYA